MLWTYGLYTCDFNKTEDWFTWWGRSERRCWFPGLTNTPWSELGDLQNKFWVSSTSFILVKRWLLFLPGKPFLGEPLNISLMVNSSMIGTDSRMSFVINLFLPLCGAAPGLVVSTVLMLVLENRGSHSLAAALSFWSKQAEELHLRKEEKTLIAVDRRDHIPAHLKKNFSSNIASFFWALSIFFCTIEIGMSKLYLYDITTLWWSKPGSLSEIYYLYTSPKVSSKMQFPAFFVFKHLCNTQEQETYGDLSRVITPVNTLSIVMIFMVYLFKANWEYPL